MFIRYSFGLFDLCLLYVWCVCVAVLACVVGLLLMFDCFACLVDCLFDSCFAVYFRFDCGLYWLFYVLVSRCLLGLLCGCLAGLMLECGLVIVLNWFFVVLGLGVDFAFC